MANRPRAIASSTSSFLTPTPTAVSALLIKWIPCRLETDPNLKLPNGRDTSLTRYSVPIDNTYSRPERSMPIASQMPRNAATR